MAAGPVLATPSRPRVAYGGRAGSLALRWTPAARGRWWPERRGKRGPRLRGGRRRAPAVAPTGALADAQRAAARGRARALRAARRRSGGPQLGRRRPGHRAPVPHGRAREHDRAVGAT